MIGCSGACLVCDFPIKFDTYKGCGHDCAYCFVRNKYNIKNISPINTTVSLKNFISGKRNAETRWCDWNIPLHWGANSDPFQVCELEYKKSLECLKIFAETKYPFIVSTKNPCLLMQEPYLSLIKQCRCVLQISMACSKYDKLERGAPKYIDRLKAVEFLSDKVTRTIVRVRPFFPDCKKEIIAEIPNYKNAGAYGMTIASFISKKKQTGMIKAGASYVFAKDYLFPIYEKIKSVCHENDLRFLCSEGGLDFMSDELNCCGAGGLDDFIPHTYNVAHLSYDEIKPKPTAAMLRTDTSQPFKCIGQTTKFAERCKNKSFAELILELGEDRINYNIQQREKYVSD